MLAAALGVGLWSRLPLPRCREQQHLVSNQRTRASLFCSISASASATDELPGRTDVEYAAPPQEVRRFMMSHRAFVSSAQRILYRDPFRAATFLYKSSITRAKAFGLRQTLVRHPHLARTVRSLLSLHTVVAELARCPADVYSSATDQAVEPWSWQADILRLCLQVDSASILLCDAKYARSIGQVLRGRLPSSLHLHFPPDLAGKRQQAILRQFASGLASTATTRLNDLRITPSGLSCDDVDRRPDYFVRKFSLNLAFDGTSLSTAAAFLPKRLDGTEELVLEQLADNPTASQRFIAALKGNSLQAVTLGGSNWVCGRAEGSKEDYEGNIRGMSLPDILLMAYPHARELTVRGLRDLDLRKLALVAEASPLVKVLDFGHSFWRLDHTDLTSEHPRTSSFDDKLIGVLDSMKHLEMVDLGILPYDPDIDCRCGLRHYADRRGIDLIMEGCWAAEEYDEENGETTESDGLDGYGYGYGGAWVDHGAYGMTLARSLYPEERSDEEYW